MANDGKKFDIELGTKADTSGLEATERALRDVETAGKAAVNPMADGSQLSAGATAADALAAGFQKAEAAVSQLEEAVADLEKGNEALREEQRRADVDLAKRLKSERELTAEMEQRARAQEALALRAAALGSLVAAGKQIIGNTREVIQAYRDLGVEIGSFETIGLEFADFLTSPFDYVTDAMTGYKADLAALRESQRRVIEQEQIYQETRRAKLEATRKDNEAYVNGTLARELAAIDAATAAYERQRKEITALNTAREASLRAAEEAALFAGTATPESVEANRRSRAQSAAQGEVQAAVADSEAKYQEAEEKAQAAIAAYTAARALNQDTVAMAEQVDAAVAARDAALLDLESQRRIAEAEMVGIASTALENTVEASRAAQEQVAAKTQDIVQAVDAGGQQLTAAQEAARERVVGALEDGRVTAQEQQGLTGDLRTMLTGFRGTTEEQRKVTENFMEIVRIGNANTAELMRQQQQLRREFDQVREQINRGG